MDPQRPDRPAPWFRPAVLALAVLVLFAAALVDWWRGRQKERRYDRQILLLSQQNALDPALVKAVVWRESRFDNRARGRVGEKGLMQIGALAAKEWAQTEAKQPSFDGDLFDAETNLRIGTWYLGKLMRRYRHTDDPVPYALADYNAGRNNVIRWNKGSAETNSSQFVAQITYPGTQEYIRSIREQSAAYRGTFQPGLARR